MDDATRYHLLRLLDENPAATQRELAQQLNFSVGKTNYCLRMLVDKGWVKLNNFRRSRNKTAYLYQLTPSGIVAKARTTRRFLDSKLREYERLVQEIEQLRQEIVTRPEDEEDVATQVRDATGSCADAPAIHPDQMSTRVERSPVANARRITSDAVSQGLPGPFAIKNQGNPLLEDT